MNIPNWFGDNDPVLQSSNKSIVTEEIENIVQQLAIDFGHWTLRVIGPVSLAACCVFIALAIVGVKSAPRRAMISGILASMAYSAGWSH